MGAEALTLMNRKRGHLNAVRSQEVRARVKRVLCQLGETPDCGFAKREDARALLCRKAVCIGREKGMRVWSANTFPAEVGAMSSLRTLLEEKTIKDGKGSITTGVNDRWVLNLWEATCDYYEQSSLLRNEIEVREVKIEDETVQALAASRSERSLAGRLLEAYFSRDPEDVMRIALLVEKLEFGNG